MKKLLLAILFVLSFSGCSNEKTVDVSKHLYKVERNGQYLYLLGTIEVGKEFDKVDNDTKKAYQDSQMIVTDISLDYLNKNHYLHKEPIKDVCQQDSLNQLMKNINHYQTNLVYFNAKKMSGYNPVAISSTLQLAIFQELGYSSEYGIDSYFIRMGKEDRKKFDELETLNIQEDMILDISRKFGDHILMQAANYNENKKEQKELTDIYYRGTRKKINEYYNQLDLKKTELNDEQKQDYQNIMINNKNKKIIKKIEDYLNTDEIEFVIINAKYVHGKNGIVSLLKQQGYKVANY